MIGTARSWFDGSYLYIFKDKNSLKAELREMFGAKDEKSKTMALIEKLKKIKLVSGKYLEQIMEVYSLQRDSGITIKELVFMFTKHVFNRKGKDSEWKNLEGYICNYK